MLQIEGTITKILPIKKYETKKGRIFAKCEVWISLSEYDEYTGVTNQRPHAQSITFEAHNEKAEQITTDYNVGEQVIVKFDVFGQVFAKKNGEESCRNTLVVRSIWTKD